MFGIVRAALRTTASGGVRVGAAAITVTRALETTTVSVARRGLDVVNAVPGEVVWAERTLLDLHERRQRRRAWAKQGRAYIEVRGVDGHDGRARKLAKGVTSSLRRLRGVRWAEVNAVTGQVLVAFDEGHVDLGDLLDTVRAVEEAHGTREEDFSWSRTVLPGDKAPIVAAATELAADCAAVAAAAAGRVLGVSPLPHRARLAVAALEVEPRLRRLLKRRIGPIETDLVISIANAAVHGLSEGMLAPTVEGAYHALLLGERWQGRKAWERREHELCSSPGDIPRDRPVPAKRPAPRPRGPIEEWSMRLGPAAPAAAGAVLALTRSPGRAADAILAAVPKAAVYGRGAFAAVAGWQLARQGIVPLNAAVLRRLDRVSAIVIDSAVLYENERDLAPLAQHILHAAGSVQADVLVTDDPGLTGLLPPSGRTLKSGDDLDLAEHVRQMQEAGEGVLVIAGANAAALAAADAGVAITVPGDPAFWSADLLCGPDLTGVWRVLQVTSAARKVSRQAVYISQAGTALAGVLTVAGRGRRTALALAPVHLAGATAMALGAAGALRATRVPLPPTSVKVGRPSLD